MSWQFNPPPGWPSQPAGWVPPPGWTPDPSWPPAPPDWQFWVPAGQPPAHQPATGQPATGQPGTGQPATGQPATGQPDTGQPAGYGSTGQWYGTAQPAAAGAYPAAQSGPTMAYHQAGAPGSNRRFRYWWVIFPVVAGVLALAVVAGFAATRGGSVNPGPGAAGDSPSEFPQRPGDPPGEMPELPDLPGLGLPGMPSMPAGLERNVCGQAGVIVAGLMATMLTGEDQTRRDEVVASRRVAAEQIRQLPAEDSAQQDALAEFAAAIDESADMLAGAAAADPDVARESFTLITDAYHSFNTQAC